MSSKKPAKRETQVDRFKRLAQEQECDLSEKAFEETLKKIAQTRPGPKASDKDD